MDQFLTEKRITRSKSLVKNYRSRLAYFKAYLTAKKIETPSELSQAFFDGYMKYLKRKGLSANTLYVYLETPGTFLRYLYDKNYTFSNLAKGIALPKWDRKARHFDICKADLPIYLAGIKETGVFKIRNEAIIYLYVLEGLNTRSISSLTVMDLELNESTLRVPTLRVSAKKKFVELKPQTVKLLRKYILARHKLKPQTDYLWVKQGGQKLSSQAVQVVMRR
ncbi:MAG: hypothetical protein GY718_07070, partial [Lentisphaerae bacterium]|nr:hypothetical protein [Lentisphaerota bacterium]